MLDRAIDIGSRCVLEANLPSIGLLQVVGFIPAVVLSKPFIGLRGGLLVSDESKSRSKVSHCSFENGGGNFTSWKIAFAHTAKLPYHHVVEICGQALF